MGVSWFLDESALSDVADTPLGARLPRKWRLGSKPNLRQMHNDAVSQIPDTLVTARLLEAIRGERSFTAGVTAAGARAHPLPASPADVDDDGEFRFVILGPGAECGAGQPSREAKRFIDETTGPDRPRVYRNAVLLVVPERVALEGARIRVRDYLAWEQVRSMLKDEELDVVRTSRLETSIRDAERRMADAVRQAYCIVVTVDANNDIQAFKLTPREEPLFERIKADERSRIVEMEISADALLPGGPCDLWREGEDARRVKDVVGAFAQFARLPKMLRARAILDTLVQGVREGFFVFRITRPDKSVRTLWKQEPPEEVLKDPTLEVVLPSAATLTEVSSSLVAPGGLAGLWPEVGAEKATPIRCGDVVRFFDGDHTTTVRRAEYEETIQVPRADRAAVETAIGGRSARADLARRRSGEFAGRGRFPGPAGGYVRTVRATGRNLAHGSCGGGPACRMGQRADDRPESDLRSVATGRREFAVVPREAGH